MPHHQIIDKLKNALSTDTCEGLVASFSAVFDEVAFPPSGKMTAETVVNYYEAAFP